MTQNIDPNHIKDILQEKILLEDIVGIQDEKLQTTSDPVPEKSLLHELNELKQEKIFNEESESEIPPAKFSKKPLYFIPVVAIAIAILFAIPNVQDSDNGTLTSNYVIQNLKGDTISTWVSWQIPPEKTLFVNIVDNEYLTPERYEIIKSTIVSDNQLEIDNALMHKGPSGTSSIMYDGWGGAMDSIEGQTKYSIPNNIEVISEKSTTGDIVIILTDMTNADGYSGYTRSITDESQNQILKSTITIHDVNKISTQELSTIMRHELGHAFGLAHSTAPEELMYPVIKTNFPYISDCTIDAMKELYDGSKQSEVICDI